MCIIVIFVQLLAPKPFAGCMYSSVLGGLLETHGALAPARRRQLEPSNQTQGLAGSRYRGLSRSRPRQWLKFSVLRTQIGNSRRLPRGFPVGVLRRFYDSSHLACRGRNGYGLKLSACKAAAARFQLNVGFRKVQAPLQSHL